MSNASNEDVINRNGETILNSAISTVLSSAVIESFAPGLNTLTHYAFLAAIGGMSTLANYAISQTREAGAGNYWGAKLGAVLFPFLISGAMHSMGILVSVVPNCSIGMDCRLGPVPLRLW